MDLNADGYLTDEEDQALFQQLYAEGLKESSKQAEKNLPIPKFYSKVLSQCVLELFHFFFLKMFFCIMISYQITKTFCL